MIHTSTCNLPQSQFFNWFRVCQSWMVSFKVYCYICSFLSWSFFKSVIVTATTLLCLLMRKQLEHIYIIVLILKILEANVLQGFFLCLQTVSTADNLSEATPHSQPDSLPVSRYLCLYKTCICIHHTFSPQGTTESHLVTTSEHQDTGNELRENGAPVEIIRVPVSATSLHILGPMMNEAYRYECKLNF